MTLRFDFRARSDVGLVRQNNQDSALAASDLLVVADGMGGAAAGDLASSVAIDAVRALHAELPQRVAAGRSSSGPRGLPDGPLGDHLDAFAATLREANRELARRTLADASLQGMGTTVCAVLLTGAGAAVVNIGDSRAYRLRDGVLQRISRDHSWVQTLVDAGRITEAQALEHPHRSLIMKVLNGRPQHEPDLDALDLRPGDRVLVCSDGLCGLVTDAQIAGPLAVPDLDAAAQALVDLALSAGGFDNITVLVGDVIDAEPDAPAAAPQLLGAVVERRAAAAATTPAAAASLTGRPVADEQRYAPRPPRRSVLRVLVGLLVAALIATGVVAGLGAYVRTLYYVGALGSEVALFRGMAGSIAGRALNEVVVTGPELDDLPALQRDLVKRGFGVADEATGRARLTQLTEDARACLTIRAARSAVPVPTAIGVQPSGAASGPGEPGDPSERPSLAAASGSPGALTAPAASGAPTPPPEGC